MRTVNQRITLTLSTLRKILSRWNIKIFFQVFFPKKTGCDISCKLSPMETICMKFKSCFLGKLEAICMKCQNLSSGKNKKKYQFVICWISPESGYGLTYQWATMSENISSDMCAQQKFRLVQMWSESLLSTFWLAKDVNFLHAENEDLASKWCEVSSCGKQWLAKDVKFLHAENGDCG